MRRVAAFAAFAALAALALLPHPAHAQTLVRPWLTWKTIETRHFVFHYVDDFADWTREVARHADAIDSAVTQLVGYSPPHRTHVLVHDPYENSNGSAWPYLNQPEIDLWATPPSPRDDIGNFRVWGEMLISHEFGHIAHLSRPSRNPFTRHLWQALPVDLGPLALRTPRWAFEGYATFIEGRITGSGRPHGAWRAAFLRAWAYEGQLPRYDQLDAAGGYGGGEFAYLAGSAFIEWLTQQHGDSSLVAVWRRLSARQNRTFDEAFTGVYGETPATLYGRFLAELTVKSVEAARAATAAADTGAIVQRLAWQTGDPAISADGKRVALVVRSATLPSRVVVWGTAAEPDTGRARRDSILLKRDPEDVPARSIYPSPKKPLETLRSPGGAPYESPRFLRDGRILLWRNTAQGDGSLRPDVYLWDTAAHRVRRITRGASVRDPDPLPDGRSAIATQCLHGWCDVVAVDLRTGATRAILRGDPEVTYYRPRVSPDGSRFVVAVHRGPVWALAVADTGGQTLAIVPSDRESSAYDADWFGPRALVAVSERSGVPNVDRVDLATNTWTAWTSAIGAAVAPVVNPADSSVWFLSLYPRGYDLRRAPPHPASTPITLATGLAPALPPPAATTATFGANPVSAPRDYEISDRLFRWLPTAQYGGDGASAGLGLVSSDLIARSEILAKAAFGEPATWRGAALDLTWRGTRPALRAQLFGAAQRASWKRAGVPSSANVDARLIGGEIASDGAALFDTWQARYRVAASVGRVDRQLDALAIPDADRRTTRALAVADGAIAWTQRGLGASVTETASGSLTGGHSFDRRFYRAVASLGLATAGPRVLPFAVSAAYGRTDAATPFERFALGGGPSPLVDRVLLTQRLPMPVLPTAISEGSSVFTYRVALPTPTLAPYFWAGSTAPLDARFASWHRVVGLDWSMAVPNIAVAGTPAARAQLGIGESLDAPLRKRVTAYLSLVLDP
ncbi:MAG TPA: hypothetical protein VHB25_02950 [Gemmatimonadaceae bacterium]|nr:hypothetical protein [Gemmatimonadaceae bacterium]